MRQMSHPQAISYQILRITSASMVATASVIHSRSSSRLAVRSAIKSSSLTYPHTAKSRGINSGDRGGQTIVPPRIPSSSTMALGSTQPLTEMSTRNISLG